MITNLTRKGDSQEQLFGELMTRKEASLRDDLMEHLATLHEMREQKKAIENDIKLYMRKINELQKRIREEAERES